MINSKAVLWAVKYVFKGKNGGSAELEGIEQ
jgi:hypothetical protein